MIYTITQIQKITEKMDILTYFKIALVGVIAYLAPITGLLYLVIAFVILDTIAGVYTSKKLGVKFQSSKFFNIVVKLFFYLSTIILAYIIDIHIFGGILPILNIPNGVAKLLTIFWIYIEGKSLDENNIRLGGLPFAERLKSLLTGLKNLKKDLKDITNEDNNK